MELKHKLWISFILLLGITSFTYNKISDLTMGSEKLNSLLWLSFILSLFASIIGYFVDKGKRLKIIFVASLIFSSMFFATLIIIYFPSFFKSYAMDEQKLYFEAIHEAGHAVVAEKLYHGSVGEGKIIQGLQLRVLKHFDNQTLAYIIHNIPEEPIASLTKGKNKICISYGGLAATDIFFPNEKYTGANSDLEEIDKIAMTIIDNGISSAGPFNTNMLTKEQISTVMQDLAKPEYFKAKQIVLDNKEAVKRLADELVKNKYLTGDQIKNIINN